MIKLAPFAREAIWYENARQLRILCKKFNIRLLTEAATGFTETVHEIFCAMAVAGVKKPPKGMFTKDTKKKDIAAWINQAKDKLGERSKSINALWDQKKDKTDKWIKDAPVLWQEAWVIGGKIKTNYLKGTGWKTVNRVFSVSKTGAKKIADMEIHFAAGDTLDVSLKAGKHVQFTNLSPAELLNIIFPGKGVSKGMGLLGFLYDNGYSKDLDDGCKAWLKFIVKNYYNSRKNDPDWPMNSKTKGGLNSYPDAIPIMDKICGIKLNDDYTVDKKGSRQSTWWKKGWKDYQPNSKVSKEIKNAIKRTYHTSPLTKSESKYLATKRKHINGAIDDYFTNITKKTFVDAEIKPLIKTILRADPDNEYLYAGAAGKKLSYLPSEKLIDNVSYKVEIEDKNVSTLGTGKGGDYHKIVKVLTKSGTSLFDFDLRFRFSGTLGQWTTDLQHKGSVFNIHAGFWTHFTEIPGTTRYHSWG
jgi:hypothetical protein